MIEQRSPAAYVAEFIGTFILVLAITLSVCLFVNSAGTGSDWVVVGLVHFLVLFLLVQTLGSVSGAHLNPAVTVALAVLRKIRLNDAVVYILLTVPRRGYQFFGYAALIGGLLGMGGLASSGELTALRAAGLSKLRICVSVIISLTLLTIGVMAMGELIAPRGEVCRRSLVHRLDPADQRGRVPELRAQFYLRPAMLLPPGP